MELNRDYARVALAGIRLFNGFAALFMPEFLIRQLGMDPATNPAGLYAFRMFGIRTILIGAALLHPDRAVRAYTVRVAVIVHASDTAAAVFGGLRHYLPARAAAVAVMISTINTILALVAWMASDEQNRASSS